MGRDISLFGIPLPAAIGGLARAEITNNELTDPGLGYTVPYNGPGEKATIYIYDLGLSEIPEDPTSDVVRDHFGECIEQVTKLKDVGIYSYVQIKERYGTGTPTSGVEFLGCEFAVRENDKALDSFLFVTSYGGKFVKVRYTTPYSEQSSAAARVFIDAVSNLLWPDRNRLEKP